MEHDEDVPVVYIDVSEAEERLLLASIDPLAGLAEQDSEKLRDLIEGVQTGNDGLQSFVDDLNTRVAAEIEAAAGKTHEGKKLALTEVTIDDPQTAVNPGDLWAMGKHRMSVSDVMTGWRSWTHLLTGEAVFCPYAGPFVLLTETADDHPLIIVQPDVYIAGHTIDRWNEHHPDDLGKVVTL